MAQAALRVRRRRLDPPRARRPRAADRLLRQPVDAGLLHGRGRRLATTTGWSRRMLYAPARPDAPHPGRQRRGGGGLPQRADRRRRAGGDGLRQLGRRARRRRLPGVQPGLHASACCGSCKRERRRPARAAASSSPRAAARGWRRSPALGADVVGLDWTVDLGRARAARRRPASRCRATSTRTCCSRGRARSAPRSRAALASFGPLPAARRATATSSTSATASASTRRRSTSRRWSTRCTRSRRRTTRPASVTNITHRACRPVNG